MLKETCESVVAACLALCGFSLQDYLCPPTSCLSASTPWVLTGPPHPPSLCRLRDKCIRVWPSHKRVAETKYFVSNSRSLQDHHTLPTWPDAPVPNVTAVSLGHPRSVFCTGCVARSSRCVAARFAFVTSTDARRRGDVTLTRGRNKCRGTQPEMLLF